MKGKKFGGRTRGTPNRITAQFKDAVRIVYDEIGGHAAFARWAEQNQGDFYRICARLIPTEISAREEQVVLNLTFGNANVLDQPAKRLERESLLIEDTGGR